MKRNPPIRGSRRRLARQGLAGLFIGLFIFVQVLAVSSPLHGYFHQDATAANHACAVTLFSHGQVLLATGLIAVQSPAVGALLEAVAPSASTASGDIQLLPGRAPPFERLF